MGREGHAVSKSREGEGPSGLARRTLRPPLLLRLPSLQGRSDTFRLTFPPPASLPGGPHPSPPVRQLVTELPDAQAHPPRPPSSPWPRPPRCPSSPFP